MILKFYSVFYAFSAILRAFWAKIAGYRVLTTPEEQELRLEQCNPCEFLTEDGQCAVCTCFVDTKTMLAVETCPKKRWRAIWQKKRVESAEK